MAIYNTIRKAGSTLTVTLFAGSLFAAPAEGSSSLFDLNDTGLFSVLIAFIVAQLAAIIAIADAIKRITGAKDFWKDARKKSKNLIPFLVSGLLLVSGDAMAAAGAPADQPMVTMTDDLFWVLISINVVLFCLLLYMVHTLRGLISTLRPEEEKEDARSFAESWSEKLSDAVPIEEEETIMFDHEYDGIRELDNNLPPWWVYGFYVTIVFSLIYLIHFHISPIPGLDKLVLLGPVEKGSQVEQYQQEMAVAEEKKAAYQAMMAESVNENNVEMITDENRLAKGKETFMTFCKTCHGQYGEGQAGPNLTDEYWKHGGGIKNVFSTIKYGVPAKGMISWKDQLTASQMHEVASYILTLQGTNPPNAKAPEGEIWTEKESPAATDTTAVKPEPVPADTLELTDSE